MDISNKDRSIDIFIDEHKNLAIFSIIENPDFVWDLSKLPFDIKVSPIFYSKTAFELKYPYTADELAVEIQKGFEGWNKLEPYTAKTKTIEEYYYKINGFKKATLGKKSISVFWSSVTGKSVKIFLPGKQRTYYVGIKEIKLSEDATWIDFANAVIDLVESDLTQEYSYKANRKSLNI